MPLSPPPKFSLLLAALSLLFVVLVAQERDQAFYCNYNQNHTMCRYTGPDPNTVFLKRGVNSTYISLIVYLHNFYRSRVAGGLEGRGSNGGQPAAANMNGLQWDTELARIAQRWADQCILRSDQIRDMPQSYGYVGQNMYANVSFRRDVRPESTQPESFYWQTAIESWYNEVNSFDSNNVASYTYNANNGHYTQIVYANTTGVGCGFALCQTSNDRVIRINVCDYGAGGNRRGLPIYTRVASASQSICTQCTGGRRCEANLCVPPPQQNGQMTAQ